MTPKGEAPGDILPQPSAERLGNDGSPPDRAPSHPRMPRRPPTAVIARSLAGKILDNSRILEMVRVRLIHSRQKRLGKVWISQTRKTSRDFPDIVLTLATRPLT